MSDVVTPQQVERRLIQLAKELDAAHQENVAAEKQYFDAKANYEIKIAKARLQVGQRYAERGVKATVQDREDEALMVAQEDLMALYNAEAEVKAVRANVARIRSQIDITRSISANVRNSMEVLV